MAMLPAAFTAPATPPHILIMDACAAVCDVLLEALEPTGYRLTACHALLEAPQVAALQPDLIIMERVFAGSLTASCAFLHQARQDPALAGVPVVLSTTQSPRGGNDPDSCGLSAGAIHLLVKPYAINDLLAVVAACVAPAHQPRC